MFKEKAVKTEIYYEACSDLLFLHDADQDYSNRWGGDTMYKPADSATATGIKQWSL